MSVPPECHDDYGSSSSHSVFVVSLWIGGMISKIFKNWFVPFHFDFIYSSPRYEHKNSAVYIRTPSAGFFFSVLHCYRRIVCNIQAWRVTCKYWVTEGLIKSLQNGLCLRFILSGGFEVKKTCRPTFFFFFLILISKSYPGHGPPGPAASAAYVPN